MYKETLDRKQTSIPTLGEALGSLKQYYPKGRLQGIVDQREDEVKKVEAQDPVPKGMKDIRAMMDKRLKALDDSGLPFMTAAAAAIKGNQPILVALTNAMIGYTAGDEQLKKQGLSLMKDMVDIDSNIATLEAGQRKAEADARSNLIAARAAAIKGDQEQENKLLAAAQAEIKLATDTNDRLQRSQVAAANAVTNFAGMTFKTKAEQERFNTLLEASKTEYPNLSEFKHLERVVKAMRPRTVSPYAEQNQMLKLEAAELRTNNQITKFLKDASKPARNLEIADAAKKDGLQLTGDDLILYGVHKGLVPLTGALQNTRAGQLIIEQAKQKFGPQAQGQDNEKSIDYNQLKK